MSCGINSTGIKMYMVTAELNAEEILSPSRFAKQEVVNRMIQ
jgi:hypothetical protein